jgi:hypothetical protein
MAMGMFKVQGFGVQGNTNFGVYRSKKRFLFLGGKDGLLFLGFEVHIHILA